jgi:hydrogenase/urease accessory protein HupE
MTPRRAGGAILGVLVAMAPRVSEAHLASTRFGDFYGGAIHVITAPEHVLALLALGLLAGLQERTVGRWMLLAAPLGLLCGTALALSVSNGAPLSALGMALLVLLGLLVAWGRRFAVPVVGALGLLVGLLHGYQNGLAVTGDVVAYLFVLGVTSVGLAAIALIAAGAAAATARLGWTAIAARAGGSWIAAVGVMMLGFALA